MSGVKSEQVAIWLAAVTAFVNFIFTLVGLWLVERIGRRKLTLGSIAGWFSSFVKVLGGIYFYHTLNRQDPGGSWFSVWLGSKVRTLVTAQTNL